jgi:hypothetical protein
VKKIGLLAAAMLFAAVTFAQTESTTVAQSDKTKITPGENAQMKELDNCIRNYNREKAVAKQARIRGEFKISKADFAIAHADKKYIKTIAAQLKSEGISHPLVQARKEIKKTDKKLIIADIKVIKADKLAKQKALKAGDSIAVKATENNLIADKNNLKKDISDASHDDTKHFSFVRPKS